MQLRERADKPKNIEELRAFIKYEWENTPLELIRSLYESISRRLEAVRKAKGNFTKYYIKRKL